MKKSSSSKHGKLIVATLFAITAVGGMIGILGEKRGTRNPYPAFSWADVKSIPASVQKLSLHGLVITGNDDLTHLVGVEKLYFVECQFLHGSERTIGSARHIRSVHFRRCQFDDSSLLHWVSLQPHIKEVVILQCAGVDEDVAAALGASQHLRCLIIADSGVADVNYYIE